MQILAESPLLALFFVVAAGALLGAIPFGPLRVGAAGALFVGLFVGYAVPDLGSELSLVQNLGLTLFVYTVGLSAGQTFFSDLKRQYKLMLASALALALTAVTAVAGARIVGLPIDMAAGVFAGAMTTTPALAAASTITGTDVPAVGYSLGYPAGVIVGIILVAMIVSRAWSGKHDSASLSGQSLKAVTAVSHSHLAVRAVPGWQDQRIKMSYLQRAGTTRVISAGEILEPDDRVVVVGLPGDVDLAVSAIGEELPKHLADDRSIVRFGSFVVSRAELAGQTIAELNLSSRFGGVVTRISRGDLEILAADQEHIELGDRLSVAYPREEETALTNFFGNSRRRVAEIDAVALGLGIVLGVLVGMVEFSLPGGGSFSLGSAAGPLVVGMVLGYLQRTGPLVWQLPLGANLTIRQLGLLLFLAAVGIASGPAFAQTAFTSTGAIAISLGAVLALVALALVAVSGKLLGTSATRTAGAMAGVLGQPALLAFAQSKQNDERIESGYAAIFAFGIVVKILLVSVMLAVFL
ncbi:MAG: TrkA C-terminal domain-containing protein [Arcanobacterium sp.]|nr:TrkA C-terminal domain-containing protein [Arcanobacterium sp.]